MSKELYFTDGNNEVKYLDTTASFNLAITQDGSAFDLTNATAIDVKVANDTGYVFTKSIDMATIKQPLAGLITMPVDAEVMNALVPDDYTIEVWVTLSSLITPGSQEGLTDGATTSTTTSSTGTATYNAIFPSDDPQGFTITENVMSDSGDVIPVMSLDEFQQEFDQLKTDLTNKVATLQGPKGDTGQGLEIKDKVDTTSQLPATASEGDGYLVGDELYVWTNGAWKDCGSLQGPQGIKGNTGTGVSSTTIQYQISNSATTTPTGTWSNTLIATTQVNPFLWTQATLNYDDGTSKSFYLVSSKGDKGDKGDTGDTGPIGPVGPGLAVKGSVNSASQLPTTGNQEGYCYFVGTDLYVWVNGAWKNCGSVIPNLSNYATQQQLSAKADTSSLDPSVMAKRLLTADDDVFTLDPGTYYVAAVKPKNYPTQAMPWGRVVVKKLSPDGGNRLAEVFDVNSHQMINVYRGNPVAWQGWQVPNAVTMASKSDVTTAVSTATANMVTNNQLATKADDSKVAHLSGDEEIAGTKTFDVAPIDKTTGNPYITRDGVPNNIQTINPNADLFTIKQEGVYKSVWGNQSTLKNFPSADGSATIIYSGSGTTDNGMKITVIDSWGGVFTSVWQGSTSTPGYSAWINLNETAYLDKLANFTAGLQSNGASVATSTDLSTGLATKADDSKVSALQTQVDNSAVGTNLLVGTGNSLSITGTNISNQTTNDYLLSNGYKVSTLASAFGTQFTISFDWSVSGSSPSGTFNTMWNNFPWGSGIGNLNTVSSSNTSGHFSNTFSLSTDSENIATGVCFRLDNFVGTLTITNVKLEKGSVATDWCPNSSEILTKSDYAKIQAAIVALGGSLS